MPFIQFENARIHYQIIGSGKPVLLLHGFLEDMHMWNDYAAELAKGFQVILIDLPGHGQSESLQNHSMDKMAEATLAVLSELNLTKLPVIGHSMGGYVALALADKHPEHVYSMLLFFSSAAADTPEKRQNRDRLKVLVAQDKNSFTRHAIPMLFTKTTRAQFAPAVEELIAQAQDLTSTGIIKTIEGLKTRPDKTDILTRNIPVSFVSGKLDEAISIESLTEQHKASAVKKVWLTENGHMGHIEDRDFCLHAIQEFLA